MNDTVRSVPIEQIQRINAAKGFHWFEPDTLRFFRSRVAERGYTIDDVFVYFVSSEQFVTYHPRYRVDRRRYSVRVANMLTGDIDTVGEFQAYASRSGADKRAVACAREGSE